MVSQRVTRLAGAARPARAALLVAVAFPALFAAQTLWAETGPPVLNVERMTFVASRGSVSEVVLRAEQARFDTGVDIVDLQKVSVSVSSGKSKRELTVTCDRGKLDLTTSDFEAEGNVVGRTEGGLEFTSDWIRYDHDEGVLFTDAPVLITDASGTFRGGGFRYIVEERRFKLLGGASVVRRN